MKRELTAMQVAKMGQATFSPMHFVEPRAITENAMRRGFAPGLE
jgi:hypothetical protein